MVYKKTKTKATAKKPTSKKKATQKNTVETSSYVLLDRSGSMAVLWVEALNSVNTYAKELAKKLPLDKITLAVFDSQDRFQVIRDKTPAKNWNEVTNSEASPRANTPLYDAILRLCSHADTVNDKKTTVVIMTDGAENASHEGTKESAKLALDACRNKGWDVIFLGANWDAMGQSADVGTLSGHTMNMAQGNMGAAMGMMSARNVSYKMGKMEPESTFFSEKDRKTAGFKSSK